ncbi:MAG: nucleotide exchange factor GrpE [Sphingobacteriales bacterium]|nr:MAG: nucleotide exchange factor GrpE [Sphingobacteriales bacterium]TAF83803.1 MAG: nucleotide exchange factor GrpE [Sphingobacteriales bacterium]
MAENKENILTEENQTPTSETFIDNETNNTQDNITEEVTLSEEDKLKAEVTTLNDKFIRLYAEFDNFKRRTQKERIDLLKTANKEVILALLPVLDDFERAEKALANITDVAAVKEGIAIVQNKLKNILAQKGLSEMDAIGHAFDADVHEAITSIPSPSEESKGKVIDQMEKGYLLNDKVIRFAKVIIGV